MAVQRLPDYVRFPIHFRVTVSRRDVCGQKASGWLLMAAGAPLTQYLRVTHADGRLTGRFAYKGVYAVVGRALEMLFASPLTAPRQLPAGRRSH